MSYLYPALSVVIFIVLIWIVVYLSRKVTRWLDRRMEERERQGWRRR